MKEDTLYLITWWDNKNYRGICNHKKIDICKCYVSGIIFIEMKLFSCG